MCDEIDFAIKIANSKCMFLPFWKQHVKWFGGFILAYFVYFLDIPEQNLFYGCLAFNLPSINMIFVKFTIFTYFDFEWKKNFLPMSWNIFFFSFKWKCLPHSIIDCIEIQCIEST